MSRCEIIYTRSNVILPVAFAWDMPASVLDWLRYRPANRHRVAQGRKRHPTHVTAPRQANVPHRAIQGELDLFDNQATTKRITP